VQDRTINLEHIDTKEMLTDPLTKGLPSHIFEEHVIGMGLMESLCDDTTNIHPGQGPISCIGPRGWYGPS
jgi:hypothetical protein